MAATSADDPASIYVPLRLTCGLGPIAAGYPDIAVRDPVMAVGACTPGRVAALRRGLAAPAPLQSSLA